MAELLLGTAIIVVAIGLVAAGAVYRRRALRDVFRQDGERLVRTAQVLVVVGVIAAVVALMIINNR
jgi:uncharacterized membrane protein